MRCRIAVALDVSRRGAVAIVLHGTLADFTACEGRAASVRHWRRELHNRPAKTCATAFPRRVLYSRGTPGIVMPVTPTAMGAAVFGAASGPASPQASAYRGCGASRQGAAPPVL